MKHNNEGCWAGRRAPGSSPNTRHVHSILLEAGHKIRLRARRVGADAPRPSLRDNRNAETSRLTLVCGGSRESRLFSRLCHTYTNRQLEKGEVPVVFVLP